MADRDRDVDLVLGGLWETPVGRRWLLKAGLGSVAAAAGLYAGSVPAAVARGGPDNSGAVREDLQFVLGHVEPDVSDLVLVAGGVRHPLIRHSRASRLGVRARGGLWGRLDLNVLSHYAPAVEVPRGRGMLLSVQGKRERREVVIAQLWYAPQDALKALATTSHRLTGSLHAVLGSATSLSALGLDRSDLRSAVEVAQLDTIVSSYQAATTLTMSHPQIATVDSMAAATTKALLGQTPEVTALGTYITKMQKAGRDYATLETVLDPDGTPTELQVGDLTTNFDTIRLNQNDRGFMSATRASLTAGITGVRDTDSLGAVIDKPLDEERRSSTATWVQAEGFNPSPERYESHQIRARAGIDVKVKNPGFLFGTKTTINGAYKDGRVPIKIYNNFVRWIWAYVQYLGSDGKNLSVDPKATWPDTKYSKSLAVVPQVFTVLGIPLWDSNTVETTLEFPEGAHTARILYCGLGADILGGGWRQYFPDGAYPNKIAPEDEVLIPAITTGLLTVGLNVFALATDIDIAVTWKKLRAGMHEIMDFDIDDFRALTSKAANLTIGETAATAVISGGATYLGIEHSGQNIDNLWELTLETAHVLPKLLFNAKAFGIWERTALTLLEQETAQRLISALPVIGQVIGVVSAVGDALTLAEVGAETLVCPWVIENEVSLSYPVRVSVSRDPRAASFPVTARSWRLDALVDGALGTTPVSGSINDGGRIRSDALVLDVAAPFGGKSIRWSVVFLDAAGRQVGTGVSAEYRNDDPEHPPEEIAFAIEQLPAAINAQTVFRRADTTTYSERAGGYTWSDQISVTGTVLDHGIQEVTGAAVATLAGVAGLVWRENERYYIRGVPVAQNGDTIALGEASYEGYSRRPFLLLDSFVDVHDRGNHVLIEPDEKSVAYQVRRVSLDPRSGAITWNASISYGTFPLVVSAAALHSSGKIVAINTDTGRIAFVDPVDTPRPQLATYTAGPGEQIGLLSSPIAVAVTNPGIVLVLEAGAQQISAFDLNGNPVRYFGRRADQFSMALASKGTYLDIGVDGANQIYVLYFAGDGAEPADYHVDVYTEAGEPLATNSPGTNIPHLAVDYWRSVYGPNYGPLTNQNTTTPHIDPRLKVREPSLSRFDPAQST